MMYFISETKKNKCCKRCKRDKGVKKSQKTPIVFDLYRTQLCCEYRLVGRGGSLAPEAVLPGATRGRKLLALELWASNWPGSGRTLI